MTKRSWPDLIGNIGSAISQTTILYGCFLVLTALGTTIAIAQSPPTTYVNLYSFQFPPDGAMPDTPLVFDANGSMYGGTQIGGSHNVGVIFQMTQQQPGVWSETVLHSFRGEDGQYPINGVIVGPRGVLYGTAYRDSATDTGTVFQLAPAGGGTWSFSVLYHFQGGSDGARPNSIVLGKNGTLYGTTNLGGNFNAGVAYSLTPPRTPLGAWTEKVIHHFGLGGDGANPNGGVITDNSGNLYGTTQVGGTSNDGTVFEMTPPVGVLGSWGEKVLHSFIGSDGSSPVGNLLFGADGSLFGAAGGGTSTACDGHPCGVVYQLTPSGSGHWTESVVHDFDFSDGAGPMAGVITDSAGKLYGTTQGGGRFDEGVAYELVPPTQGGQWPLFVLHNFGSPTAWEPESPMVFNSDGALYGAATAGGTNGTGVIFRMTH